MIFLGQRDYRILLSRLQLLHICVIHKAEFLKCIVKNSKQKPKGSKKYNKIVEAMNRVINSANVNSLRLFNVRTEG